MSDNGSGITRDNFATVAQRHCTSKIERFQVRQKKRKNKSCTSDSDFFEFSRSVLRSAGILLATTGVLPESRVIRYQPAQGALTSDGILRSRAPNALFPRASSLVLGLSFFSMERTSPLG